MKKLLAILALGTFAFGGSLGVNVTFPSGAKYSGAKVVGQVCGLTGGMTSTVYTNSSGYARLEWGGDSYTSLCSICVNGNCYDGRYQNGSEASFTAK